MFKKNQWGTFYEDFRISMTFSLPRASHQESRRIRMKRKMGNELPFYSFGQTAENFQPSVLIKGKYGRSILGQE